MQQLQWNYFSPPDTKESRCIESFEIINPLPIITTSKLKFLQN